MRASFLLFILQFAGTLVAMDFYSHSSLGLGQVEERIEVEDGNLLSRVAYSTFGQLRLKLRRFRSFRGRFVFDYFWRQSYADGRPMAAASRNDVRRLYLFAKKRRTGFQLGRFSIPEASQRAVDGVLVYWQPLPSLRFYSWGGKASPYLREPSGMGRRIGFFSRYLTSYPSLLQLTFSQGIWQLKEEMEGLFTYYHMDLKLNQQHGFYAYGNLVYNIEPGHDLSRLHLSFDVSEKDYGLLRFSYAIVRSFEEEDHREDLWEGERQSLKIATLEWQRHRNTGFGPYGLLSHAWHEGSGMVDQRIRFGLKHVQQQGWSPFMFFGLDERSSRERRFVGGGTSYSRERWSLNTEQRCGFEKRSGEAVASLWYSQVFATYTMGRRFALSLGAQRLEVGEKKLSHLFVEISAGVHSSDLALGERSL